MAPTVSTGAGKMMHGGVGKGYTFNRNHEQGDQRGLFTNRRQGSIDYWL